MKFFKYKPKLKIQILKQTADLNGSNCWGNIYATLFHEWALFRLLDTDWENRSRIQEFLSSRVQHHIVWWKSVARFGGTYHLHLQGEYEKGLPEDGSSMFLRTIHSIPQCYIPQDKTLSCQCYENLKPNKRLGFFCIISHLINIEFIFIIIVCYV
jgi:hypothetical protein